jgi:acyl-CoA thioester hydrolase
MAFLRKAATPPPKRHADGFSSFTSWQHSTFSRNRRFPHNKKHMNAASSQFDWNIRVYYEDTDTGGVVFYANYLKFFERARTEWLRSFGFQQQHLADTTGAIFIVKSTAVDYLAPARLDDELSITVVVEKLRNASIEFVQEAWRLPSGNGAAGDVQQARLLARGRITVVCIDAASFRPQPIPAELLSCIKAAS